MKNTTPIALVIIALFSLVPVGCSAPSTTESASSTPPATGDAHTDHDHGEHAHTGDDAKSDMEKMKSELAKLSPEDAASAEQQHMCPVSGEMLGAMGAPKKIYVNDRHVWICCDSCKDKLLASPKEYLDKLRSE